MRGNGLLLYGFIIVLFLVGSGIGRAEEVVNPHNFRDKKLCTQCHAGVPKLKHDPVSTCTKCHMANISNHPVARHPIGVAPAKASLYRELPLSREGTMVCYTCHEHHGDRTFYRMLRVEYHILCIACHKGH